jgi:hypothetical protein
MSDFIEVMPDCLDAQSCRQLVQTFEASPLAGQSAIISTQATGTLSHVRRSSGLILSPQNCGTLYQIINDAFRRAFVEYRRRHVILERVAQVLPEASTLVRYSNSDEHYDWHVDGADAGSRYRFLSAVLYLNTVEKGGETEFRAQQKKIPPREGAILMFPSGWTHEHRGLPPVSGPKYIITNWLRFADYPAL